MARRRRVRRAAVWGGIAGAAGVVPIAIDGTEHLPWWFNLTFCLILSLLGAFGGAVTGHRDRGKAEVRRDTLDAGERELNQYRVLRACLEGPLRAGACTTGASTAACFSR